MNQRNGPALRAVGILLILVLAAAFRTYRLLDLFPTLVDEAIYFRWAEIIRHQHEWFISLLDGKAPLSYWLLATVHALGPDDPLIGGRLVSVAAGVISTYALFRLTSRLGTYSMGLLAALIYAVLPYAVLYDRIAYTDALVNLCAILSAWASVEWFHAQRRSWLRIVLCGATLSIAILIKTTAVQFLLFPLFVGVVRRSSRRDLATGVTAIGCIALVPLFVTWSFRPRGPMFQEVNPLWHRSDFFISPFNLIATLVNLRFNFGLILGYFTHYVTVPLLVLAFCGFLVFLRQGNREALAIILAACGPLVIQVLFLQYFPSRYPFPHVWPLITAASAVLVSNTRAGVVLGFVLFASLGLRSWNFLQSPDLVLHESDRIEFLDSGPYSGFGAREAALFLREEANESPFVLLTDPYWGPPADTMFAYLQGRAGVRVFEAWWLGREIGPYPLLPPGWVPVWKSQYQRVQAGALNFDSEKRIYFVTDTNYRQPFEVMTRASATLVRRFPKKNGVDYIDVYRLR